jgi:F420-dependent oxidoreductase-like protein
MNGMQPRFSVQPAQQFMTSWADMLRTWQEAERLGYDTVYTFDHLTSVAIMTDPFEPSLEAWTVLAALAALTKRVRLGTLVTGNTYRHPAVLAKMATTVDAISGGRLDLGIGSGWYLPDHEMFGIPFRSARERCEMLDEALVIIRKLWAEHESTYAGKYFQLQNAIAEPKPIQKPHPPIMIAASGEKRMLRIVARHADAWNSFGSPEVFRRKTEVLAAYCREEGRDVDRIEKSVLVPVSLEADPAAWEPMVQGYAMYQGIPPEEARDWMLLGNADAVAEQIEHFLAVGVTHVIIQVNVFNRDVLERFALEVMPIFRTHPRSSATMNGGALIAPQDRERARSGA